MLGLKLSKFIVVVCVLFVFVIRANNPDSLLNLLKTTKADTSRLKIYGQLFLEYRESNADSAISFSKQGIALAEKLNDKKAIAKLSHNLGTFYYLKANYPLALSYCLKALAIRESLSDSVNMVKSYNNIGLIYYEENNLAEALKFHKKSIAIKEKLNDRPGLASSYGNIGNVYFKQGKNKSSDSLFSVSGSYHEKALTLQTQISIEEPDNINNLVGLSATYNNLGNINFEKFLLNNDKNLLLNAVDYHFKALEIQIKVEDIRGICHSYINIAGIKVRLGKIKEAISDYEKALTYSLEMDDKESTKAIYEGLSDMYEREGDYKKSLKYYKLFNSVKDSILDVNKSDQLTEMQTKYEADKKSKEIELLNKDKSLQENELKRQTILRNSFIIGFLLVIGMAFVIYNRSRLKSKTNSLLQKQNEIIGEKNKEITDSIKYAKRIQEAILPPKQYIDTLLQEHFIFYKPKDIVSGDFYWVDDFNEKVYVAAVDCTGHGVPGAFISIVGYNLLKHAIHEHNKTKPSDILDQVNKDLSDSLRQSFSDSTVKDGMDIALCCFDLKNMTLEYAGANNSIYIISTDGHSKERIFKEIKADKHPIGVFLGEDLKPFTNQTISIYKNDIVYLFTDGYSDQFGGPQGKKFKYKKFEELLLNNCQLSMNEQKEQLSNIHENWKGQHEQIDDILVFGIKV